MNFEMTAPAGKLTLAVIASVICAEFQYYAPALVLLAVCIITDYITGIVKAWNCGTLSSRVGVKGLVTKICYLIGVAVGFGVDLLIRIAVNNAGFEISTPFIFGLVVTLIFICNELLSIIENIAVIGVPIPSFLIKALRIFKKQFEGEVIKEDP